MKRYYIEICPADPNAIGYRSRERAMDAIKRLLRDYSTVRLYDAKTGDDEFFNA